MDVLVVYVCGDETTLYLFCSPEQELRDQLLSFHNYQVNDASDPDQDEELAELLTCEHAVYSTNPAICHDHLYQYQAPTDVVICGAVVCEETHVEA